MIIRKTNQTITNRMAKVERVPVEVTRMEI